jgi:hypothetical protein
MPFCPNCKYEYVEGASTCSGCGARLATGSLPQEDKPVPGVEYVRLTKLPDPAAALVFRATLAEAGIPAIIQTYGAISGELAGVARSVTDDYALVLVPEDCLADAQRIVQAMESGQVEWPEGMEPED